MNRIWRHSRLQPQRFKARRESLIGKGAICTGMEAKFNLLWNPGIDSTEFIPQA
jgi:hypothetical protein